MKYKYLLCLSSLLRGCDAALHQVIRGGHLLDIYQVVHSEITVTNPRYNLTGKPIIYTLTSYIYICSRICQSIQSVVGQEDVRPKRDDSLKVIRRVLFLFRHLTSECKDSVLPILLDSHDPRSSFVSSLSTLICLEDIDVQENAIIIGIDN